MNSTTPAAGRAAAEALHARVNAMRAEQKKRDRLDEERQRGGRRLSAVARRLRW